MSRVTLKKQNARKVYKGKKWDVLETATYQKLENMAEKGSLERYLKKFDTIVCDEFQYFLEDSEFNLNTALSFEAVINSEKTILLLSATGDNMANYITEKCGKEIVRIEFDGMKRIIPRLWYYDDDTGLERL